MKVVRIVSPELDNNTYIVVDRYAAMIDPSTNKGKVLEAVKKYKPVYVILTHAHFDHTQALHTIKQLSNAKIVAHRLEGVDADMFVEDRERISLGDVGLKVLHTPGHTKGSICLYEQTTKSLFSGDTLFPNGVFGRVDLPGGSLEDMIKSLKRLSELDAEILYPGHGKPVGNARKHALAALKAAQHLIT
jgi:glyoxylase-like metal-dependent hydrolase (beta-lactamase superfamily II)